MTKEEILLNWTIEKTQSNVQLLVIGVSENKKKLISIKHNYKLQKKQINLTCWDCMWGLKGNRMER